MRNLKITILTLIMVAVLINCKKEEDPAFYAGNWSTETTLDFDSVTIPLKIKLRLTNSSFTESYQFMIGNEYVTIQEYKGSLSVDDDLMTRTINEFGLTNYDGFGNPTGVLTYYKEDSPEFKNEFGSTSDRIVKETFSIEGNILSFYYDFDQDGKYDSPGEIVEYLK